MGWEMGQGMLFFFNIMLEFKVIKLNEGYFFQDF